MCKIYGPVIVAVLLVVLMGAAGTTWAEDVAPVRAGSTVRVVLVEPKHGSLRKPKCREGTLLSLNEEGVALVTSLGSPPLVLARDEIERIELKTRVGHRTTGALIGAGLGAVTGLILGAGVIGNTEDDPDEWLGMTALENGAVIAVLLAMPGAVVGALVAPGEKWQEIDPAMVRVGCILEHNGAVGLRIARKF